MNNSADIFAERLLQVIDEGRRTATYKLALLTALIDACAADVDNTGCAPAVLHTRTVAAHVLRIYFPQARSYLVGDGDSIHLSQITMKNSAAFAATCSGVRACSSTTVRPNASAKKVNRASFIGVRGGVTIGLVGGAPAAEKLAASFATSKI